MEPEPIAACKPIRRCQNAFCLLRSSGSLVRLQSAPCCSQLSLGECLMQTEEPAEIREDEGLCYVFLPRAAAGGHSMRQARPW